MEIWKNIDENYKVSNHGNIKNRKDRILKTCIRGGYKSVKLYNKKHYLIHKLVADNFLSKIDGKEYVDHIDRNKFNNHLSNLRWSTRSENIRNSVICDPKVKKRTKIEFFNNKWMCEIEGEVEVTSLNSIDDVYNFLKIKLKN